MATLLMCKPKYYGIECTINPWMSRGRPASRQGTTWVVMSALDRGEATQQYGPMGNRFVAKPFDPWDVVRLLNQQRAQGDRE